MWNIKSEIKTLVQKKAKLNEKRVRLDQKLEDIIRKRAIDKANFVKKLKTFTHEHASHICLQRSPSELFLETTRFLLRILGFHCLEWTHFQVILYRFIIISAFSKKKGKFDRNAG